MLPSLRSVVYGLTALVGVSAATPVTRDKSPISPKVMIISMFEPEGQVWLDRFHESGLGNITAQSIPVRGLSMLFPEVHCIKDGSICQLTVGEGEINAAASIMAFFLSDKFDLRNTYFVLGGIAGVNPRHATLGSVAFSRYAVQVALQYELDSRSIPDTWHTGYIPYGRESPFEYPTTTYGTEVFELNDNLRHLAYKFASRGKLQDANGPQQYRARYLATGNTYKQATQPPTVLKCDTATSEVYYSGKLLSEAFENTTRIWTNGTGVYCMSAQEDNAILEGLVRGTIAGLVDFSRVILYRAGSDFDRPPPGQSDYEHLIRTDQNGFEIAINNTYNAAIEVVHGIVAGWNCTFARGVKPANYIGDIFGSLGGHPDFGLGSITDGKGVEFHASKSHGSTLARREMGRRRQLSTGGARKM